MAVKNTRVRETVYSLLAKDKAARSDGIYKKCAKSLLL